MTIMTVCQCNRCKKVEKADKRSKLPGHNSPPLWGIFKVRGAPEGSPTIHLCPTCVMDFSGFMAGQADLADDPDFSLGVAVEKVSEEEEDRMARAAYKLQVNDLYGDDDRVWFYNEGGERVAAITVQSDYCLNGKCELCNSKIYENHFPSCDIYFDAKPPKKKANNWSGP